METNVQRVENKSISQTFSDAYASVRDTVKANPVIAVVGAALAGAAAWNSSLLSLTNTEPVVWGLATRTTPSLLGKALNLITMKPNEAIYLPLGMGANYLRSHEAQVALKTAAAYASTAVITGIGTIPIGFNAFPLIAGAFAAAQFLVIDPLRNS